MSVKKMKFNKVVIYGHKLYSHTHSYPHHGYFKAFKHLGYDTLWVDDKDNLSNINFDNCLFLTEGQVCSKIPINRSSKYILHNCDGSKFSDIDVANKINLQFFHKDVASRGLTKINEHTYVGHDVVHQAWATDLLPHEFSENDAHNEVNNRECYWAGSIDDGTSQFQNGTELNPFFNECRKNNIRVTLINPWSKPATPEENRNKVHNSFLAPTIQGPWQRDDYYVPCRIFKNISYGHMGITNNSFVNKLFGDKLVYSENTVELFHKSIQKKKDPNCINEIKELIKEVKEHHTYINRINSILDCFK